MRCGKIISMEELQRGFGIRIEDETTRKTMIWLIEVAKEAGVNYSDISEFKNFCRYILICINKVENLAAYIEECGLEMSDFEVICKPIDMMDKDKGDK